jgi:2-polyprenyl-6-methoxyphenol hydroxylase-like FAD-dependent oxidoreductase
MTQNVLIIGGGPVGLTLAIELARYGVPVRIVEKAAHRTDKSKAVVLWSRTLELLDRAGCTEGFVAGGQKVNKAHIIAAGKPIGDVDIRTVESPFPYALMVPQSDTERLLEEHLGKLGVTVERQIEMTDFTPDDSGVTTVLRHADGQEETVRSEWLIGCDGAHSIVRHKLGLSFEGETLNSDWALADIHMTGFPFPETEMATYWHQDGVLVVIPMSRTRFRIIADLGPSKGETPAPPTLDQVQAIISQRGPADLVAFDPIWLAAFRINERKVTDYRSGRVFVVGDAAHIHSPAGGQGMNTGMQDAFNLAWKLAMVCQKTCSPSLLDSYSVERSEIGDQVLKAAGRLTAVAVMRNHTAQTVRNLIGRFMLGLAPVRRAMVDTMTEVSIGYSHSPLNGPNVRGLDGPEPGERMPPVSGQVPVGTGDKPRFALFGEPSEATARLISNYPQFLEAKVRPFKDAQGAWLVRPDGYTACVAKKGDAAPFKDYFAAIV